MKINVFLLFISIALTILLGYWIYDIAKGKENDVICGILSSVCIFSTLIPFVGLQYNNMRIGVNIRVLSGVFFSILFISNFLFAYFGIIMPTYMIINGLILVVYWAILYKMKGIISTIY